MVTLHHFSEPSWFDAKGGWRSARTWRARACRGRAASRPAARTGARSTSSTALRCAAGSRASPPGKRDDLLTHLDVIRNMLVAHTAAASASARRPPNPVHVHLPLALAHRLCRRVVAAVLLLPGAVLQLRLQLHLPRWPPVRPAPLPFHLLAIAGWRRDVEALRGTIDVIGVNHYYRSLVSLERDTSSAEVPAQPSPTDLSRLPLGLLLRASSVDGFEKSDMGWDLTPSSMERLLTAIWERYRTPIIVTESGIADGDDPDDRRTRYLAACLGVASRLRARGVDLRGYLFWTLMDLSGRRIPAAFRLAPRTSTLERHEGRPTSYAPPSPGERMLRGGGALSVRGRTMGTRRVAEGVSCVCVGGWLWVCRVGVGVGRAGCANGLVAC